jgi:hypothetical protein
MKPSMAPQPADTTAAKISTEAPGERARGEDTRQYSNCATEANRPPPKPAAVYDVAVTLQLAAELPKGEPVRVRSKVGEAGERIIALQLNANHILVLRALKRADTLLVRFLLCMAVAEYLDFWGGRFDGRSLRDAITKLAGIEGEGFWGITLASKLTGSELLRTLDRTPIFGPAPSEEVFELFRLKVQLRTRSDIPGWRPKQERKENVADV